jgi:hypothetical protein
MSNLLVVDWDYFFYNPLYAVDGHDPRFWLFDWGHREDTMFRDHIWPMRGAAFLSHGMELPGVQVPENWWARFNIADDAVCEVSDSNMYSGVVDGGRVFKHVWLFDAHHDCYRIKTEEQLAEFAEAGNVTCEDWMFVHHVKGAKLHWRWPKWFTYGKKMRATEIPKWIGLDARKDDLGKIDMRFDAVSICRSGSWVPPWCDEEFERFYTSCPASEIVQVDDVDLKRAVDMDAMRSQADMLKQQVADIQAQDEKLREHASGGEPR